jgi:Pectate lyase superfamily protein
MTINLVNAAITSPASGGVSRTFGARMQDVTNVVDLGADPTGVNDSSAAFQAGIAKLGLIFVPPGSYKFLSSVNLPFSGTPLGGESYFVYAYGAFITGNFAGFLFKRTRDTSDNQDRKGFFGCTMINQHAAGGCLYWGAATDNCVVDCTFQCDGISVAGWQGNGPQAAVRCKFEPSGLRGTPQNSTGITISTIGGLVESCDFTSLDRCAMISGSNNSVFSNRFEVDNKGVCVGMAPTLQIILSTSSGSGGAATLLNMSNTLLYESTDGVQVGCFSGQGYNINGTYTVTVVNSTTLSIPKAFSADSLQFDDAFIQILLPLGGAPGGGVGGGNGNYVGPNSFEGCVVGVFMSSGQCVIGPINCQGEANKIAFSNGNSRAGIYLINDCGAFVIQACNFAGDYTLGCIYYGGSGGTDAPSNNLIQVNAFSASVHCGLVDGHQAGVTSLTLYDMPRWIQFPDNTGGRSGVLTLISIGGVAVTAGTTITFSTQFPAVATTSHAVTGNDFDGLIVNDSLGNRVGLVSVL